MLKGKNKSMVQSATAKLNAYKRDDFERTWGSRPTTMITTRFAQTPIMKTPVKK